MRFSEVKLEKCSDTVISMGFVKVSDSSLENALVKFDTFCNTHIEKLIFFTTGIEFLSCRSLSLIHINAFQAAEVVLFVFFPQKRTF